MNPKIKWLRDKITRMNMEGMIVSNPINIRYLIRSRSTRSFIINKKRNYLYYRFKIY
ncbi:MAG: hypothetical protein HFJ27_02155 [Clostridia bacterium]|nr:hypothetical protein [Clostridia bacterium]